MGDFSVACSVSGLPIGPGDSVRFFLLCMSPYDDRGDGKPGLLFFPRTVPFFAEYNGHGTVEGYDEASPQAASILTVLATDLVEVGVGDHGGDSPTNKDMSFKDLLDALRNNRVLVKERPSEGHDKRVAEWERERQETEGDKILRYPTIAAVRKVLKEKGIETNFNDPPYYVDEIYRGWIRVRVSGYGEVKEEQLQSLLPMLSHWRAMITEGIETYGKAEIQIMPNPGYDKFHFSLRDHNDRPELPVRQAFIYEEVWQHFSKSKATDKQFESIREEYQEALKLSEGMPNLAFFRCMANLSPPFCVGLTEHFEWVIANKEKFSEAQITQFVRDLATLVVITHHLHTVSSRWVPNMLCCGPQDPDHGPYVKWHKFLLDISKRRLKKETSYED